MITLLVIGWLCGYTKQNLKPKMSKNLARLLTVLLVRCVNENSKGMDTSSMEYEKLEQMFINNNFTSIEYWIKAKLKKK